MPASKRPNLPPPDPETPDSVEVVFRAFLGTSGLLRKKMREYFTRFGISGAQWGILRILYRAELDGEPGIRLTDIGQRVLITPPSVTGAVNRLEKLGWVTRTTVSSDQRAKHVTLTPKGRELITRVKQGHRARVHTVMAGLTQRELRDLNKLLAQLTKHIETIPAE
jgi:DNA-binding MarR family transcriptional regulator